MKEDSKNLILNRHLEKLPFLVLCYFICYQLRGSIQEVILFCQASCNLAKQEWIYFILVTAIFLVKPSWVNASQGNQIDLVKFFLLPSNQLPIVMAAWSLIHELWFYLIFALLLNFNKRILLPALMLLAGIIDNVSCCFSVRLAWIQIHREPILSLSHRLRERWFGV